MPSSERTRLALLTLAFALSGCAFALGTPLFQTPDEPAHVDLVRHHARRPLEAAGPGLRVRHEVRAAVAEVGLPDGGPLRWDAAPATRPSYRPFDRYPGAGRAAMPAECQVSCQNYHFIHPPAYYVLLAPLAWVLRRFAFPVEVLWLRLAGVALVTPVVPLSWYAARQVWGERSSRPLAAAAVVAFAAPLAASAAAVNNDALALALAGATTAAIARVVRAGATWRRAALLGALTGAGLLTKAHFLAFAPVAAVAVALGLRRRARPALATVAAFAVPAAAGAAWWVGNLVRSAALTPAGSEILLEPSHGPWRRAGYLTYVVDHGGKLVNRLWGEYGWQTVAVPRPWRVGLAAGAAALGLAWLTCRRWRRPSPGGLRVGLLAAIPVMLAAAALFASFDVYRTTGQEARGLSGRYVYAAIPVLALGVVGAVGAVGARVRRFVPQGVLLGTGIAVVAAGNALSLAHAFRGLYRTRSTALLLDRADATAPLAALGPRLAVLGAAWVVVVAASVWLAARSRAVATEPAPQPATLAGAPPDAGGSLPQVGGAGPVVPDADGVGAVPAAPALPNLSGLHAADERRTDSGIEIHPVYTAADLAGWDPAVALGEPGRPPFTRGARPPVDRSRPWSVRHECRFATAEDVNAAWRALLAWGATDLACRVDLATELGYDSDDPAADGEVGVDGLAVDSLLDARQLVGGLPLGDLTLGLGAGSAGPLLVLLVELAAEERGFSPVDLEGRLQNDVLTEQVTREATMLPLPAALRLVTDTVSYCRDRLPRWTAVCVAGHDLRESGATAVQELAFSLAIGAAYLRGAVDAGLPVDDAAPRIAFSWGVGGNLFEEVAKLRAARRMWSRLVADRFDVGNAGSLAMRCHAHTSTAVLTAAQPVNNVARVTVQAMAAALGGAESLQAAAFDDPLGAASAQAARVAVRTQHILAHESRLGDTADPLGGSWFVESLTDDLEREAWALLDKVDGAGGTVAAVASGWMRDEIAQAAGARAQATELGELVVVGVTRFVDELAGPRRLRPADATAQRRQSERVRAARAERAPAPVDAALDALADQAARGPEAGNLLVSLREALRHGATVGEVARVLRTAAAGDPEPAAGGDG